MRIFKAEVKQMKDDDEPGTTGQTRAAATDPEPLEGRVVRDEERAREARRES
jgi:hypothetical protein